MGCRLAPDSTKLSRTAILDHMAPEDDDQAFRDSVHKAFGFLIEDFGYEIAEEDGDSVTYEKDRRARGPMLTEGPGRKICGRVGSDDAPPPRVVRSPVRVVGK